MSDQPTFSLQEAADIAGVKRDTLRQWLQRGHLNVERGPGLHRWTWAEVFYAGTFAELVKGTEDFAFVKEVSGQTFAHFRAFDVMNKPASVGLCVAYRSPETGQVEVERFTDTASAMQFAGEVLSGVTFAGTSPAEIRVINVSEIKSRIVARLVAVLAKRKEARK